MNECVHELKRDICCFEYTIWIIFEYDLFWSDPCHQAGPSESLAKDQPDEGDEGALEGTISSPIAAAHTLEDTVENCISTPNPARLRDIPNGTDTLRWSPESNNLDSTVDEGQPLIDLPPESIEMTMWSSDEQGACQTAPLEVSDRGRCCCSCCRCCQSGRAPALCSVLASLLSTAGILYALYFYVPIEVPDCPDMLSRLVFTLGCCAVAAIPVLLGMSRLLCFGQTWNSWNLKPCLIDDLCERLSLMQS